MLNLNELETKWLQYKIKSYVPHAIILLSSVVIISVIYSIDFDKEEDTELISNTIKSVSVQNIEKKQPVVIESSSVTVKEVPVIQKVIIKKSSVEQIESVQKDKKMLISPSLNFMKTMNNNSPQYYNEPEDEEDNIYVEEKTYKQKYTKQPAIKVKEVEVEVVKDNVISINRRNTQDDIQHVVKRFKKSNNPALSLFIAKKYYELEDYNQAYNYALITNELNNDIEDSWMIFAKSLVKLNKKIKAVETLEKYVDHSHSSRAKILLDNIKSGKMK